MPPVSPFWLRLVTAERGAILWIAGLWAAGALVLFAMVQASRDCTFYNYTRELRVAVGPVELQSASPDDAHEFTMGLRQGLAAQRELTLVGDEVIRRRVEALLGKPAPDDLQHWMRATRNLNVSVYVSADLQGAAGGLRASVSLWRVANEVQLAHFSAVDGTPHALGRALADSLRQVFFMPQTGLQASR